MFTFTLKIHYIYKSLFSHRKYFKEVSLLRFFSLNLVRSLDRKSPVTLKSPSASTEVTSGGKPLANDVE